MIFSVYVITNTLDGVMYVGKAKDPHYRWSAHRSLAKNPDKRTTHFYRALHMYGADKFERHVVCQSKCEKAIYEAEELVHKQLVSAGCKLYNEKEGGRGGHSNPSPSLRKKLSVSRTGNKHPMWGKPNVRRGGTNTPEHVAAFKQTVRNQWYGKQRNTPSQETKDLWSDQRKGRPFHGKSRLTCEEKSNILEWFDEGKGLTASEIAVKLNRSVSIVHRIIRNRESKVSTGRAVSFGS